MSDHTSPLAPIVAPFASVAREFADLLRNPTAFVGGLAGTAACMAAAVALALFGTTAEAADEPIDDELIMDFVPGALVRKGPAPSPDPIPEKPIVDATRAVDTAPTTTVTTDQNAASDPKPPPKTPPKPKPPTTPADPNHPGRDDTHTTDGNNTHHDPTNAQQLPGDPFGSVDGWADMAADGDPWATAVLAALNNLTVGSYAGLGQDVTYKFQLVLCADGKIDDVRTKQSTGKPDFDGLLRNALETLKLPKAPPAIASQLAGKCKKIPYVFTWSGKGSGGKVK